MYFVILCSLIELILIERLDLNYVFNYILHINSKSNLFSLRNLIELTLSLNCMYVCIYIY